MACLVKREKKPGVSFILGCRGFHHEDNEDIFYQAARVRLQVFPVRRIYIGTICEIRLGNEQRCFLSLPFPGSPLSNGRSNTCVAVSAVL
jgi:hypothetical protein